MSGQGGIKGNSAIYIALYNVGTAANVKDLAVNAGMGRLTHKWPAEKAEPPEQLLFGIGGTSVLKVFHMVHENMLSAKQAGAGFKIL